MKTNMNDSANAVATNPDTINVDPMANVRRIPIMLQTNPARGPEKKNNGVQDVWLSL